MVSKKETAKTLERTYTVPLRKEYMKVARWKRTNKAVVAMRQFVSKHMKSKDVKLGKELNDKIWNHGMKNPPHHVKITASKDDKGVVKAELFGIKKKEEKKDSKKKEINEEKKPEAKASN